MRKNIVLFGIIKFMFQYFSNDKRQKLMVETYSHLLSIGMA